MKDKGECEQSNSCRQGSGYKNCLKHARIASNASTFDMNIRSSIQTLPENQKNLDMSQGAAPNENEPAFAPEISNLLKFQGSRLESTGKPESTKLRRLQSANLKIGTKPNRVLQSSHISLTRLGSAAPAKSAFL